MAAGGGRGCGGRRGRDRRAARPLAGKTFVLTGTLPDLSRQEATDLIVAAGGRVTGSVSAKTDYVVVGDGGRVQLAKARRSGHRPAGRGGAAEPAGG